MEPVITHLKDNAVIALMILITALYQSGHNRAILAELAAVRAEMAAEFNAAPRTETADTNERLARVGTRLDSIVGSVKSGDFTLRMVLISGYGLLLLSELTVL